MLNVTLKQRAERHLFTLLLVLSTSLLSAQNTVGMLTYDIEKVDPGYNLFFPFASQDVYLLDNCGRICNFWDGDAYVPGMQVHLHTDGMLYKAIGNGPQSNEWFHAGGGGEGLEIRDVDNNITWQYFVSDSIYRFHHDFSVMPNGNILAVTWERHFEQDCIENGADPERLLEGELWSEVIYEIEPVGSNEANIVWEWHAWDHLVQDFDDTQANFGTIADEIGKIDINFTPDSVGDWLHCNGIDYNPSLDLIALSIPTFNEIWVIDHSTTTEQAATSSGGFTGSGGELVYRWGNPLAYDQGTEDDQILYYQHHVHWLDRELTPGHPDYGKMGVFSNRHPDNSSHAMVWSAAFDDYEWEFPLTGNAWGPSEPEWDYTTPDAVTMYSNIVSSMQRLPNGNTLIGIGRWGRGIEIDADENVVWDYIFPFTGGTPVTQGTELAINESLIWRYSRFSESYPGLDNMDLTPMGYVELEPNEEACPLDTQVEEISLELDWNLFPNPTHDVLNISLGVRPNAPVLIAIYDISGALLSMDRFDPSTQFSVEVHDLPAGTYTLSLKSSELGQHNHPFVKH